MVISNYFSKAAASLPEQSGSDKASIYLHTLKVECPVSSEGSFLREAIQKVLVKMITADPTIRFSTVTDQHVDPNGIPKDNSVFNDRFNVKTNGNRRKATISAFFKAHSAKTLYELKKELWTFLTKHGIYLQNSPGNKNKQCNASTDKLHVPRKIFDERGKVQGKMAKRNQKKYIVELPTVKISSC